MAATLALPRMSPRALQQHAVAWVIAAPSGCCWECCTRYRTANGFARPGDSQHALDHFFALSHRMAATLCGLAAMPALPSVCGPGWLPEGQVLRHWLRKGEVRLLPLPGRGPNSARHATNQSRRSHWTKHVAETLDEARGAPFFGFDAWRVKGTVRLLNLTLLQWTCASPFLPRLLARTP